MICSVSDNSSIWIWPKNKMTEAIPDSYKGLEEFFNSFYAPFKTLYFSRGRVAITAILESIEASRNDLVFIQPYSSYCVQSAISKVSTPLTIHPEDSKYQIVYHNFGKKAIADRSVFKNVIIEDSVDSLVISNEETELFPNGGDYAIFSLSKLLHLPFGSIVVCRTDEAYSKLKNSNLRRQGGGDYNLIKNQIYTDIILYNNPTLIPLLDNKLDSDVISKMFYLAKERIETNVNELSTILNKDLKTRGRLPSNIFSSEEFPSELYEKYDVEVKQRHIFDYTQGCSINVYLFPVHIDVEIKSK